MLTLALVAVLSAEEVLPPPPPPPPLVPAESGPGEGPPPPPYLEPPPPAEATDARDPNEVEATIDEVAFSPARVTATGAVAAATGATLVGLALYMAISVRSLGSAGALVATLSLPASLFLGTGLAVLAHRGMGGKGGYGGHLAGGAIGGGVALVGTTLLFLAIGGQNPGFGPLAGWVTGAAVLFGAGTGLMAELSHFRTLRELRERHDADVALVPVPGGAVAMAGFRF